VKYSYQSVENLCFAIVLISFPGFLGKKPCVKLVAVARYFDKRDTEDMSINSNYTHSSRLVNADHFSHGLIVLTQAFGSLTTRKKYVAIKTIKT